MAAALVAVVVGVLGITVVALAAPGDEPGSPLKNAVDLRVGDATVDVIDTFQADVKLCMKALGMTYYEVATDIPATLTGAALDAYTAALVGTEAAPGCLGQGVQEYVEVAPPPVDASFFKRAEQRPVYKAAMKSWQKCMAMQGFNTVSKPDDVGAAATAIAASDDKRAGVLTETNGTCLVSSGLADVQAAIITESRTLGG